MFFSMVNVLNNVYFLPVTATFTVMILTCRHYSGDNLSRHHIIRTHSSTSAGPPLLNSPTSGSMTHRATGTISKYIINADPDYTAGS